MSHRRLPKSQQPEPSGQSGHSKRARRAGRSRPTWQVYAAVSAAVVVVAGGAAFAATASSGGGGGGGTSAAAVAAEGGGTDPAATSGPAKAPTGSASPSATPSGSSEPGKSPTATPKGSASASGKAPADPSAKAPGTKGAGATPDTHAGPPHPADATVFTGLAFDTCTAPSASKMSSWRTGSPFGGAAVYIGGANRGCAQPQLTSSWVRTVHAQGWALIPIYVGAQPPCQSSGNPERITAANAASLGASDGAGAVADAAALGMRAGSAVYLDMEAYDSGDTACGSAVLTYIQAWDKALHGHGYWAGFYGFTSSSAAAVAKAKGSLPDMPDALWYAKYDGGNTTTGGFPFDSGLWTGHRRGHQYQVGVKETFGGVALTVDRDAWDAPVAVVG